MNFNYDRYVPRLLWKQGEYCAVYSLAATTKAKIMPLIDVPTIGWDFEKAKEARTLDEHLEPFAKRVLKKWGKAPCFVDCRLIDLSRRMGDGTHPLLFLFNDLRKMECSPIPVFGCDCDREYQGAVREILTKDRRGACLRVKIEHAAKGTFKEKLDYLLGEISINNKNCDLILDLGAPNFVPLDDFSKLIQGIVNKIPYLNMWRSFSIMGTSFPENMGGIKRGLEILTRFEWQLYKKIITNFKRNGLRLPAFGDYVICHPKTVEMDMRKIQPSAAIRYTTNDNWCIVKGMSNRKYPFQFKGLCQTLLSSGRFSLPRISYGDDYIINCARNKKKRESLMTWRKVGTNRHIEQVVRDISNYFGGGESP